LRKFDKDLPANPNTVQIYNAYKRLAAKINNAYGRPETAPMVDTALIAQLIDKAADVKANPNSSIADIAVKLFSGHFGDEKVEILALFSQEICPSRDNVFFHKFKGGKGYAENDLDAFLVLTGVMSAKFVTEHQSVDWTKENIGVSPVEIAEQIKALNAAEIQGLAKELYRLSLLEPLPYLWKIEEIIANSPELISALFALWLPGGEVGCYNLLMQSLTSRLLCRTGQQYRAAMETTILSALIRIDPDCAVTIEGFLNGFDAGERPVLRYKRRDNEPLLAEKAGGLFYAKKDMELYDLSGNKLEQYLPANERVTLADIRPYRFGDLKPLYLVEYNGGIYYIKNENLQPDISKITEYTVIGGDTLSGIGQKLGLRWQDIARFNNINAPYVIHPGQALKLPSGQN
jgi:nucleoid-associated protein YgaU